MTPDPASQRVEYELGGLAEADLTPDPMGLFARWYDDAQSLHEPNAMVLATSTADGRPSARAVLLKGFGADGFRFFTNFESRKGHELMADPACALTFPWFELQRQVRVEGVARRLPEEDSDAYFAGRPRGSQLGAWASHQSREVADRAELDAAYADAERRLAGADVPRPPYWGGYLVVPETVEFWQGRRGRMHDRLRYQRDQDRWRVARLAP